MGAIGPKHIKKKPSQNIKSNNYNTITSMPTKKFCIQSTKQAHSSTHSILTHLGPIHHPKQASKVNEVYLQEYGSASALSPKTPKN